MAICGIPVTRLGQYWAHLLPQFILMGGFALLMLAVSWRFYKKSKQTQVNPEEDTLRLAFISNDTGKFIWTPVAALVLAAIGMLTGLMTGLLGVGGGFLIVGSGGVANALLAGAELPVVETSSFVGAMIGGMLVGRRVSRKLQAWQVQRGFALLLFAVSLYMLGKAYLNFQL
jgi:uncharacterized membrane protein YfcA